MSALSAEGRRYFASREEVDGVRFVQLAVMNSDEQLVTRDHFTVGEGRVLAAALILELEGA